MPQFKYLHRIPNTSPGRHQNTLLDQRRLMNFYLLFWFVFQIWKRVEQNAELVHISDSR